MSNLDPALDGNSQQRADPLQGHSSFDRLNSTHNDQYRIEPTNANQAYGAPQQTPYYHYQTSIQQSVSHDGLSSGSAQPTPDAHTFLPPAEHQTFAQAGDDSQAAQDDTKRQRACEACRGLKVRCDQDPNQPDVPCKRCAKAGRQCIITQPSRKRQKKADGRVAELEKKLDALTAVLQHRHGGGNGQYDAAVAAAASTGTTAAMQPNEPSQPAQLAWQAETSPDEPPAKRRRTDEAPSEWNTKFAQLQLVHKFPDAKNYLHPDNFTKRITSLIPPAQGAELFKRFTSEMTAELPLVVFAKGTTGEQVFRERPILYLAIITAASFSRVPTEVTTQLQDETMAAIADLTVRRGVKSLELIQAMQVVSLFYKPPAKAEQTNFYQLVHMAAVMALDIGLGRRYNSRNKPHALGRQEVVFSVRALTGQNSDLIEARRAWLGCYYLCATASMVLRRPNLLRWTDYMKECIEVLETSPEAAQTDRLLCEHVKIQHICEDIGEQFLMDDANAQVSINDPKVTYALNVFENQLNAWKTQVPSELRHGNRSLDFFEHVTNLYLHEIALHMNHNIEDFRLPFTEESLRNVDSTAEALSPNKIAAIEACLKASHGILAITLSFNADELLALPLLIFFVRCVYALVILIKMHVAITMPASELGKIIKPEELKVEEHVHGLLKLFQQTGESSLAKPEKSMKIMSVLSEWFAKHKENLAQQRNGPGGSAAQQMPPQRAGSSSRYDQTPLQMLSQVATGQQRGPHTADWTLDSSEAGGHKLSSAQNSSDYKMPAYQSEQAFGGAHDPNILSMLDMLSGDDYGFGTGFEQAMDMTMSGMGMGDLQGYGLSAWSAGDSNGTSYQTGSNPHTNESGQWP